MEALQFNLTSGVTPNSHDIYTLHMTIFWVCVAIGIIVFGAMTYAMLHHRKSLRREPATFYENTKLEIFWTIIPFLILVAVAIPTTRVLRNINDTSKPDITIKITGYQWRWRYEYLEQGISFFSNLSTPISEISGTSPKNPDYLRQVDHPLVVPIHKKIRFLVTANDVIHSWWVPDLGVKQDAIPGFINENWAQINRAGVYHGQCSELCGLHHAYMPIVVIAMSQSDFAKWVNQQTGVPTQAATPTTTLPTAAPTSNAAPVAPSATTAAPATSANAPAATATKMTKEDLMKKGEGIYQSICAACHQPNGQGMPPTFPALKGSAIASGPLPAHLNRVLNGKPGTAMQAFKDQMNDEELAAVITFERNAFNNTGDLVQPAQVKAARTLPPTGQ